MDPGTALAVVSLTFDVFAGCIRAFNVISEAGNLGRDAALERTKLLLQEYRLVEWAKAVRLDDPAVQVTPGLNQNLAALLLVQLEHTLSSTERLKQRYHLELVVPESDTWKLEEARGTADKPDVAASVLGKITSSQTRQDILGRISKVKGSNTFPKRLWWAAVDKQKLSMLVADVTTIVDGLWTLLDTVAKSQMSRSIGHDLATALKGCDDIDALKQLQSTLEPGNSGFGLSETLAASAGLKATRLSNMRQQSPADRPNITGRMRQEKALLLDSTRIEGVRRVAAGHITVGRLDGQSVLIEEKPVHQQKMKSKLQARVIELANLLSQPRSETLLTLTCLGFTVEPLGYRLVFSIPPVVVSVLPGQQPEPTTLHALLCDAKVPLPSAGIRLHLALQIAKTVLSFHAAGWLHKDIRSANVVLFPGTSPFMARSTALDVSHPFLTGFTFARRDRPTELSDSISANPETDIYRHPRAMGEDYEGFSRHMDAYALGCVFVEIAEWAPLRKIVRKCVDISHAVNQSDIAALPDWLRARYVGPGGMAGFRLGGAFQAMLDLCFRESNKDVDVVEFLDALQDLERCWVEHDGSPAGTAAPDQSQS